MKKCRLAGYCCRFDSRFAVLTATIVTYVMSFLSLVITISKTLLDFCGEPALNADYERAGIESGLMIAQFISIGVHLTIVFLTTILLIGILREHVTLLLGWLVGFAVLVCLELICMIYSVVLLAHIHKGMDALLQAEVAFCLIRLIVNGMCTASVVAFYRQLTAGRSWMPLVNTAL